MTLASTVHTTGINWESAVTITGGIVVIMTAIFGLFSRYVANRITDAINRFRLDVLTKMEERIVALENYKTSMESRERRRLCRMKFVKRARTTKSSIPQQMRLRRLISHRTLRRRQKSKCGC